MIPYSNPDDLDIQTAPESLSEKRREIISLCKEALKQTFIRGDYKELISGIPLVNSDKF